MNSKTNSDSTTSPSAKTPPHRSRYFTVRWALACWRFLWSRRMVWTLALLASIVVLFYQYEYWHGARELEAARKKMIARCGTDNFVDLLPEQVSDEENFWAIDEIKSWRVADPKAAGGYAYAWPENKLASEKYEAFQIDDGHGGTKIDLTAWAAQRDPSLPPLNDERARAEALLASMDDHGIIARLTEGLARPHAQIIPSRRQLWQEAKGDPLRLKIQSHSNCFHTAKNLQIRLQLAALSQNAELTRDLIGIQTRLAKATADDTTMVGSLVSLALNNLLTDTLNAALANTKLTNRDFSQIARWLQVANDVEQTERMLKIYILTTEAFYAAAKSKVITGELAQLFPAEQDMNLLQKSYRQIALHGPSGWFDHTSAFAKECWLSMAGEGGGETWRTGQEAARNINATIKQRCRLYQNGRFWIPNLRYFFADQTLPTLSNLWETSVKNLFKRRCAILICALHRHRLAHGTFPDKLADVDAGFLPAAQPDPAKVDAQLSYRRMDHGFLLWSVGDDRTDDDGDATKDWVWQHDFKP